MEHEIRLIDANALKIDFYDEYETEDDAYAYGYVSKHQIDMAPTIDAVNVVRCGECKWEWTQKCPPHRMGLIHDKNDYCSYGIRKGADDDR